MHEEFVLREVDIAQDAEKLAEMWKASDDQWPGTWSGGVEITPEMVTEWHGREKMLNVYVMETADKRKIVGYCSLSERESEKNTGYLALLNVQPDYQGKSLGRRLVAKCVDRCVELGYHLLTIGTWSGNLKSVPLYKKCGYFWIPDTSVYMLNFIPAIMQLPCAKAYFSRYDWYRTFKRELKQVEDDERWEGMKVFKYHWEADGEALTVWADRESERLTAVETDAFFAAAIPDNIEPARGMSTTLRWRVKNKQNQPMSVSLIARGTEHLKLQKRAMFELAPGETRELEASVDVDINTPDLKRNRPVPSVRTLFILDGEVLELGTGLQPRKAVSIGTAPDHVTLFPGVAKTVHIQLHSYLRDDIEAIVSIAPTPGLVTDWSEQKIAIPAKGFAALPVTLQAERGGVFPLTATISFEDVRTKPEQLAIFCMPPGGLLAYKGKKELRIENEQLRVFLRKHAGDMGVHKATPDNAWLGSLQERLGPPFWPSEFDDKAYDITWRMEHGRIVALMTADSETYPGVTLRREVVVGGGPLISVSQTVANNGTEAYEFQVSNRVRAGHSDGATLTLPLRQGLVQDRRSEFPAAQDDVDKKPEGFAERWFALQSEIGTWGAVWGEKVVENAFGWGISLLTEKLSCLPQQWTPAGKMTFYAGSGDWRTVRDYARRLTGADAVPEPIPASVRNVHDARLDPAPFVTVEDQESATFVVDNLRGRSLEGQAILSLPEGVRSDARTFALKDICRTHPLEHKLRLTLSPEATAYEGDVLLETQLFNAHIAVPVIRFGDRGVVNVVQGEEATYTIDNGRTRLAIAPAFSAAVFKWEEGGINHLLSPYPESRAFSWVSPWFGGITPIALRKDNDSFPGKLHEESFAAEVIDLPDARGIPWRGLRLRCEMARERMEGLQLVLDYLTVGHSNVLKLVISMHNSTTAKRHLQSAGWATFWQPDGTFAHNVLRDAFIERKPTPWFGWSESGYWAAVTNAETGRTAIMVSPYPKINALDWDTSNGHFAWLSNLEIPPQGSVSRICYIALCGDLAEAKRYIALKEYH